MLDLAHEFTNRTGDPPGSPCQDLSIVALGHTSHPGSEINIAHPRDFMAAIFINGRDSVTIRWWKASERITSLLNSIRIEGHSDVSD